MAAKIRAPSGDPWRPSSLHMDHMMMLGWLRSRWIMEARSDRLEYEVLLGVWSEYVSPRWRFSSMTSMPSRSQASRSEGVGGLWDMRQALLPISLSFFTRQYSRLSGTAIPTPAKSWWLHIPWIFTGFPFR